jgi:hypothetical protein
MNLQREDLKAYPSHFYALYYSALFVVRFSSTLVLSHLSISRMSAVPSRPARRCTPRSGQAGVPTIALWECPAVHRGWNLCHDSNGVGMPCHYNPGPRESLASRMLHWQAYSRPNDVSWTSNLIQCTQTGSTFISADWLFESEKYVLIHCIHTQKHLPGELQPGSPG